jgi:hypothetical protein
MLKLQDKGREVFGSVKRTMMCLACDVYHEQSTESDGSLCFITGLCMSGIQARGGNGAAFSSGRRR